MCRKVARIGVYASIIYSLASVAPGIAAPLWAFSLTSPAFKPDADIPAQYTCEGSESAKERHTGDVNAGISPTLSWDDPPAGTQTFALLVDDPDAQGGSWIHWVVYDIPGSTRTIAQATPKQETLPDGSKHGLNDWRNPFYQGPCPPRGDAPHRYVFTLYALDSTSGLEPAAKKTHLMLFITKHTLAKAELVGHFGR